MENGQMNEGKEYRL